MAFLKKVAKVALVIVPVLLWVPIAAFLSFDGIWMQSIVPEHAHDEFMTYAKQTMDETLKGNGALVLIENGEVVGSHFQTARAWRDKAELSIDAKHSIDTKHSINGDTLFSTASMSKFIAAIAIHKLADNGDIQLDNSVGDYLTSWSIPKSNFNHQDITIERLLGHTSGLTDGLGFGNYESNEALPSVVESLNAPRASVEGKRIEVGVAPGTEFRYSGGGYLILEQLIEELTQQRYSSWVGQNVLKTNGMVNSTFDYVDDSTRHAGSFDAEGNSAPVYQYASSAATALNASANDLAGLVKSLLAQPELLNSLSKPVGSLMGAPIWGRGAMLYVPLNDGQFIIGHDGSNDPAINTSLRINPVTGDGYIALVTGHSTLASEIGFEWTLWQSGKPDFIFFDRALSSAVVPMVVGSVVWIAFALFVLIRRKRK